MESLPFENKRADERNGLKIHTSSILIETQITSSNAHAVLNTFRAKWHPTVKFAHVSFFHAPSPQLRTNYLKAEQIKTTQYICLTVKWSE